ncbi:MAG: M13 family metallopeptidase [Novosphingobium sp.]|uniref:M13 family metallopeptidase n=1 Tax=Novosphingobium sp. TaxID=1874826 RepID=UPI0032B86A29
MRLLPLTVAILLLAVPGPLAAAPDAVETAIRPGDDFYGYANARWLAEQEQAGLPDNSGTTAVLIERNKTRVRGLIAGFSARPASADERKAGLFHASLLDTARIERLGLAPLQGDLAAIARIAERRQLAAWLGAHLSLDDGSGQQVDAPLGIWVHQGFHDADRYAVHLIQGGLGLDRADYADTGPAALERRAAYARRIAAVLQAAGHSDPAARAQAVVAFEGRIAAVHASAADSADVHKTDNAWSRRDFSVRAAGMDWQAFLTAAGLAANDRFVVWQPGMVAGLAQLVAEAPLEPWRDYLTVRLIAHHADALPGSVTGAEPGDRAAVAVERTRRAMPDVVGRAYAARYFQPTAKASAQVMVESIRTAFADRLAQTAWMGDETRVRALAKLAALQIGVGYPDSWATYSALNVVRGDALGNLQRAERLAYRRALAKLGRPVDPGEWAMAPEAVGAILTLSPNAMQFSAGLLQPPYFDPHGDTAANFGSAGAGLAHEVSHSFDPVGNDYDSAGRLVHWWSAYDQARYTAAGRALAVQIGRNCPLPGSCLRGEQVLGESSADLVGLEVAYAAYRRSLNGREDSVIDGLSGDQRFFIAFARRWRRVQSDAALRRYVERDGHLPPRSRAEAVRNLDAWYAAFGVKPGDALYLVPQGRVRVWTK